jgi:hypothetical protein
MAEIAYAPISTEENGTFSGSSRREDAPENAQKHRDNIHTWGLGAQGVSRREDADLKKRLPEWLFVLEDALRKAEERGCGTA